MKEVNDIFSNHRKSLKLLKLFLFSPKDFIFKPDAIGGDIGNGINVGYAAYGFVDHIWLLGREYL